MDDFDSYHNTKRMRKLAKKQRRKELAKARAAKESGINYSDAVLVHCESVIPSVIEEKDIPTHTRCSIQ